MKASLRIALILLILASLACNLPTFIAPGGLEITQIPPTPKGEVISVPDDATPTATPFKPVAATPTYLPTPLPTRETVTPVAEITEPVPVVNWGSYPGPSVEAPIEIPAPLGILPGLENQVNIMLLGSDQRPNDGGLRTDTLMLVTLNPNHGTVSLTSFPRDLYVYIPGWTMQRLNTAYAHGGFDLLALTMEYNFGVRPDYYVLVNFGAFQEVIDGLGGIDVYAGRALVDHRDGYGDYSVEPGLNHMDGETALWYVRARYSTSDFDRTRRQQEVVQAIFLRLLSLQAVQRAPELFNIYINNVTTNLNLEAVTPLLPLASQVGGNISAVHHYYIGPQQVTSWRVPTTGAAVLLPNRFAVLEVMQLAISNP